ncbi:MAG: hypothetical protein AAF909_01430 [Pseudomonadota bacterium]
MGFKFAGMIIPKDGRSAGECVDLLRAHQGYRRPSDRPPTRLWPSGVQLGDTEDGIAESHRAVVVLDDALVTEDLEGPGDLPVGWMFFYRFDVIDATGYALREPGREKRTFYVDGLEGGDVGGEITEVERRVISECFPADQQARALEFFTTSQEVGADLDGSDEDDFICSDPADIMLEALIRRVSGHGMTEGARWRNRVDGFACSDRTH